MQKKPGLKKIVKHHNLDQIENVIQVEDSDLLAFYEENKSILPASITQWENLFIGKQILESKKDKNTEY